MDVKKRFKKELWDTIRWDLVEAVLKPYESIRAVFSLDVLLEISDRSPYFCHPLVRWCHYPNPYPERILGNFDRMIGRVRASGAPGVERKIRKWETCGNQDFWTNRSELFLGDALLRSGIPLEFLEKDRMPDLLCRWKDGKELYIEVTSLTKHTYRLYELEEFLKQVWAHQNRIKVEVHDKRPLLPPADMEAKRGKFHENDLHPVALECLERLVRAKEKSAFERYRRICVFQNEDIIVTAEDEFGRATEIQGEANHTFACGDPKYSVRIGLEEILRIPEKVRQLSGGYNAILAVDILFNGMFETAAGPLFKDEDVPYSYEPVRNAKGLSGVMFYVTDVGLGQPVHRASYFKNDFGDQFQRVQDGLLEEYPKDGIETLLRKRVRIQNETISPD